MSSKLKNYEKFITSVISVTKRKKERNCQNSFIYIYLFENHSHLQEKLDCGERETKRDRASIK